MKSLLLALLVALPASAAEPIKLTVFHTNDIHGWIMSRPDAKEPAKLVGGFAAAAAVAKAHKGHKLVLDAGDWYQGTPEGTLSRGLVMIDLFNALPFDAVVPGNHEYDFGQANLEKLVKAAKIPVLAANIYRKSDGQRVPWLKPWLVKEIGGVKVGLFGITTSKTPGLSFPEHTDGLEFRREADEAKLAVAALKKLGATVIIAVTHVGVPKPEDPPYEGDQVIAAEVEGIDLIVGGHSHTFLKEPIRDATHGTLITQAGTTLSVLGEATLEIDPVTKKVVASRDRHIDLDISKTGEDPAMLARVRKHQAEVSKVYDQVVATAPAALVRNSDGESALGAWMTDCAREYTGAEVAFQNGGGIRADIPAGPVTRRTLFNVMPFDNRIMNLKMEGEAVKAVVDHGVGMRRIMQFSGLEVVYSRKKPSGQRVKKIADEDDGVLEPGEVKTVATLDFMVRGGDGFSPLSRATSQEQTQVLMRDVLIWCAEKHKEVRAPKPGRMSEVGD